MLAEEVGAVIVRAERLKLQRYADSDRVRRLRVFRTRIHEWAAPSPVFFEEPIIVVVKEGRSALVRERKIVWWEEFKKDHLHLDVVRFRDLVDKKRAAGFEITVRDGVLAYLLVFGWARKSIVTGFLWAVSDLYPEFRSSKELVKVEEVYRGLGPEEVVTIERGTKVEVEDIGKLSASVGQALSRFQREGLIERVK